MNINTFQPRTIVFVQFLRESPLFLSTSKTYKYSQFFSLLFSSLFVFHPRAKSKYPFRLPVLFCSAPFLFSVIIIDSLLTVDSLFAARKNVISKWIQCIEDEDEANKPDLASLFAFPSDIRACSSFRRHLPHVFVI